MCKGGDCPLRDFCYRFRARPSDYQQSYFTETPNDGDTCAYHLPMVGQDGVERTMRRIDELVLDIHRATDAYDDAVSVLNSAKRVLADAEAGHDAAWTRKAKAYQALKEFIDTTRGKL